MNIFILDTNPFKNAIQYHDKHIIKMALETAQMMCSNIYVLNGLTSRKKAYKNTNYLINELFVNFPKSQTMAYPFYRLIMPNHPCTIWLRESRKNFEWGLGLLDSMLKEYFFRFKKQRDLQKVFQWLCEYYPYDKLPDIEMTDFKICISDTNLHDKDVVTSYRNVYTSEKLIYTHKRSPGKIFRHSWTNRNIPEWITEEHFTKAIYIKQKELDFK